MRKTTAYQYKPYMPPFLLDEQKSNPNFYILGHTLVHRMNQDFEVILNQYCKIECYLSGVLIKQKNDKGRIQYSFYKNDGSKLLELANYDKSDLEIGATQNPVNETYLTVFDNFILFEESNGDKYFCNAYTYDGRNILLDNIDELLDLLKDTNTYLPMFKDCENSNLVSKETLYNEGKSL